MSVRLWTNLRRALRPASRVSYHHGVRSTPLHYLQLAQPYSTASDQSSALALPISASEFEAHLHRLGLSTSDVHELYSPESPSNSTLPPTSRFPFAVALSGGADSMALMLLLNEFLINNRIETPLLAITIDHALRAESGEEARHVGEIAGSKWGVRHVIMQCDWKTVESGAPRKSKLQEYARDYRYKLLIEACESHGVSHLFVAHNLGDQLETVLFRLGRASGVNGLAGIAAKSFLGSGDGPTDIQLMRPLLDVSKASLKATCDRFQQPWVEDPSNESLVFDRIRIRAALRELEQQHDGDVNIELLLAFQQAATRAKDEFLEREHALTQEFLLRQTQEATVLSSCILIDERCFDELAMRILATLVRTVGGKSAPPRLSSLEGLLRDLRSIGSGKKVTLSGCCITKRNRGRELHFEREHTTSRP